MTQRLRATLTRSSQLLAATLLVATAGVAQEVDTSASGYGYFRTVEGEVQLTTFDKAEPIPVEPNYPVLTGDRLWVRPGSRVEMVLPDASVLRAGGDTDLYLESLALSADNEAGEATVIDLLAGTLQIRVADHFEVFEPVRIDVEGANVYLQQAGVYAVEMDDEGRGLVVVREGFAEIATDRGSVVVRSGEASDLAYGYATVASARGLLPVESWGMELDGYAVAEETRQYVDPQLAYAAAPLERHGAWVSVSGQWAWQPAVVSAWRPFSSGWWVHLPAGISWVSSEPWGWVTSHYGLWDYAPGFGWVWYPGSYYSPAWVYWYWGPTHVAWVPAGYYSRYYGPSYGWGLGLDFRYGVYGWAGGPWDVFGSWTFCPVRYFGRRGYGAYWRSGRDMGRYERYHAVPRGMITNDTRALSPDRWGKPQEIEAALRRTAGGTRSGSIDLVDVSDFVARRNDLSANVREAVFRAKTPRVDGRPQVSNRSAAARPPWTPDRRALAGEEIQAAGRGSGISSLFGGTRRDPAVVRGASIETYRRPTAGPGWSAQPGDRASAAAPRLGSRPGVIGVRPEIDTGSGGGGGELRGGTVSGWTRPSVGLMPPSARAQGRSGAGALGSGVGTGSRSPVIQQLIERMRSQPSAGATSRPGSASPPPARSDGGGSSASSSSGSGGSSRSSGSVSRPSGSSRSSASSSARSRSGSSRSSGKAKSRKPPAG